MQAAGLRPLRHPMAARRGDFAIVVHAFESAERPPLFAQGVALVTGLQAHMPGARGLVAVPRSAWVQAWAPAQTTEGAACRKL
jgi:hypothetical protein